VVVGGWGGREDGGKGGVGNSCPGVAIVVIPYPGFLDRMMSVVLCAR
jgi:hypothetical protein